MDKIDTANWNNFFGETETVVKHSSDRYSETVFSFKEKGLPSGKVHAVTTPGMLLTELELRSDKPFQMNDSEPKECAESVFILDGKVESSFSYLKDPLYFSHQNHNIQYSSSFGGDHTIHSGNFHVLAITYDVDYLGGLLQCDDSGSLETLGKNISKRNNFLATQHSVTWNPGIANVVQSIRNCKFEGPTRYIFIESKMLELFVLQMEQLHSVRPVRETDPWRKEDREKLFAVKEHIEQAYLEHLSLKDLTYAFGLNEFKLKKGFRHFFNTTVFGHILDLRMQKAKSLLGEQQMNVSEIARFIGYANTGSFSSEFKKRFGYSPSQNSRIS